MLCFPLLACWWCLLILTSSFLPPGMHMVTGQLGSVMKESVSIAYTFARQYLTTLEGHRYSTHKANSLLFIVLLLLSHPMNYYCFSSETASTSTRTSCTCTCPRAPSARTGPAQASP